MSTQEISSLLKIYEKHSVNDLKTFKALAIVFENNNKYISKKVYNFLIKIQTDDESLVRLLKAYRNKHKIQ